MASRSRALLVTVTSLAAVATTVATATTPVNAAVAPAVTAAADATSPLELQAARSSVTAPREGRYAYIALGVYAVAGDEPFRIDVRRPSYRDKLTAVLRREGGDLTLPAGSAREDWSGLARFYRLTVTDRAGKTVVNRFVPFCPNSYSQNRARPGAPSSTPYPYFCQSNPYGLSQVWGLQAGWATPVQEYLGLPLKLGRYTATMSITPGYVRALGLTGTTSATVGLRVVKGEEEAHQRHAGASHRTTQRAANRAAEVTPTRAAMRRAPQVDSAADVPDAVLSDLRSLPAWGIGMRRGKWLEFSATVWNAGPSPLVVDAFRRGTDSELMDAYQYFFDGDGEQVGYAPVGTMEWDARDGHDHWHFTDFASYRLLDADKQLVVRSRKEAFCLANTDAVDYAVPGANWRPGGTDLHTSCGEETSVAVRQTLETGSGDTYAQYLPGQSFNVADLPNGTYYIQVLANPEGALHEASTTNNSALRRVIISGAPGAKRVRVPQIGVIDESQAYGGFF